MTTETRRGIVVFGGTMEGLLDATRKAEEAGFDSVWTTDFYIRSASISLAAMAMVSNRITIGSAIAYATGRSPLVLATEARDINELSSGRVILGLGTGTKKMQRDWHGEDPGGTAARLEELIPLLRRFWSLDDEGIQHDGRFFHVDLKPTGTLPASCEIPVYLAGVNRRMLSAAGAVADGQIGHPLFTKRYVEEVVIPTISEAATRHGRHPEQIERVGYVICSISEDEQAARREAKQQIAFYALVKTYDSILAMHDLTEAAADIRKAWMTRDPDAMAAAVPDRMVDLMALAGTPDAVREQYDDRFEGLHDHALLYSPSFGLTQGRFEENLSAILDTFRNTDTERTVFPA